MQKADDRGPPAGEAESKRSAAKVPLRVDWHDYIVNRREPGAAYATNYVFRPARASATGFQYRATAGGVASFAPNERINWPKSLAGTVTDGSITWTAEAISSSSFRSTIATSVWTADTGLTLSDESNADQIYTTYAAGGNDGADYDVKHTITLTGAPAEKIEALIVLPVRD